MNIFRGTHAADVLTSVIDSIEARVRRVEARNAARNDEETRDFQEPVIDEASRGSQSDSASNRSRSSRRRPSRSQRNARGEEETLRSEEPTQLVTSNPPTQLLEAAGQVSKIYLVWIALILFFDLEPQCTVGIKYQCFIAR